MSEAFVLLLMGGAYTVMVFVLGAVFEHWRHGEQAEESDQREQVLVDALMSQREASVNWIPDEEQ